MWLGQRPAATASYQSPAAGETPAPQTAVDTLVVCPDAFQSALQPWCELRRAEGHHIARLSNLAAPEELRRQIRQVAASGRLRFVVLVGAASSWSTGFSRNSRALSPEDGTVNTIVPMHYAKARVNVKWGSTPTIASDNWYVQPETADDEHPMPALAIGRIPAESPEELAAIVKKIVAYERSRDFGPWRRQMNFVAGVGNFGVLADSVIESAATLFLTQTIPAEYHVSMTYGNWRSPYLPRPAAVPRNGLGAARRRGTRLDLYRTRLGPGNGPLGNAAAMVSDSRIVRRDDAPGRYKAADRPVPVLLRRRDGRPWKMPG